MSPHRPALRHSAELHALGLKATLPRLRVLQVFQRAAQRHLSAEEVFRALLAEGSEVSLATVYRVLMQFAQAGLLVRQHFEGDRAVFELNEGHHHDHLVCLQCGRVEEFHDPVIEARQQQLAEQRGFALHDHALSLYDLCDRPGCRDGPGT